MSEIGRKTLVGIGKETTYGVKASTIEYFICDSFDPGVSKENIRDEGMFGSKSNRTKGTCVVKKWAEPSLEGLVYDGIFGHLIMAALGTDVVTGASPYTHTFAVNEGDIPSYTIVWKDGNMTKMMTGAVLNSTEINQETGDFLRHSTGFMAKFPVTTTETPGITAENKFCSKIASLKLENAVADLPAGTSINAESFRLTIDKGAEALYVFGSNEPSKTYDKAIDITGEFKVDMDAGTYLDLAEAGTVKALQFESINTEATGNPTIRFTLDAVDISEWSRDGGKDDRVTQTCGFVASYDLAAASEIEAVLINSRSATY